jgi:probable F420-dependent oxidoreductase
MRLGVSLEPLGPGATGQDVLRAARAAERMGFDSVLMSHHFLANPAGSALDPLVLLSAVAGATERIGLATSVLVLPYHHPVLLANQAASLDVVSGGRFVLAIGAGWNQREFDALGVPLTERGARTDEYLAAMRVLWNQDPASFEGHFTSFSAVSLGAPQHTPGGPPIWVGGDSDAALRRALRYAQAWHGSGVTAQGAKEVRHRVARIGDEVGRDPATLELTSVQFLSPPGLPAAGPSWSHQLGGTSPSAESVVDELGRLQEAGISLSSLWMAVAAPAVLDAFAWVAEEVMPRLGARASAAPPASQRA